MKQEKKFIETDIFRTSSLLLRKIFEKVKNLELDIKRSIGDEFLSEIKRCCEYAKLSWVENKDNKVVKLTYMLYAKREICKAEASLNLIVSAGLFPGKRKKEESEEIYLNGGSEISKYMGLLLIQLDSLISALSEGLDEKVLTEIYSSIEIR